MSSTCTRSLLLGGLCWLGVALGACQTYGDQLQRGQGYYEQNQYEHALAVLRHLEANQDSLDADERVRYCYLRGMTDFRLEYRADARYWLGLSRAGQQKAKTALDAEEQKRLEKALAELNAEVFSGQAKPPAAAGVENPIGSKCQWSSECAAGLICQDEACVSIE